MDINNWNAFLGVLAIIASAISLAFGAGYKIGFLRGVASVQPKRAKTKEESLADAASKPTAMELAEIARRRDRR